MKVIYFCCLLTIGQGAFLALHMMLSSGKAFRPMSILALVVLIEVFTLYDEVLLFFGGSQLPISLYYFGTPLLAAVGPMLLGYAHLSSGVRTRPKPIWILHLSPALAAFALAVVNYHILPYAEKEAYLVFFRETLTESNSSRPWIEVVINSLFRIYFLTYLAMAWRYLKTKVDRYQSRVTLGFVQFLILGLMCIALMALLIGFSWSWSPVFSVGRLAVFLVIFASHIFGLTYLYFSPPKKLTQTDKYRRSGLSPAEEQDIRQKLEAAFNQDKAFKDPLLTLQKLARKTETNGHYLSQVINSVYGKSFNELINSYRLEEAKRLLSEKNNHSVADMASLSGFASASSFFRLFKKATGVTPSQFREQQKSDR